MINRFDPNKIFVKGVAEYVKPEQPAIIGRFKTSSGENIDLE